VTRSFFIIPCDDARLRDLAENCGRVRTIHSIVWEWIKMGMGLGGQVHHDRKNVSVREGMSGELHIREQGWSLTEVLTVLAITGLLAALAWPSYQTMTARVQARSATSEIASELRLARQLAMARRERLRVTFDRDGRTITLRRGDVEEILNIYHYADKGVVVEEPTSGPELFFYPSGRSATPTTIRIRDSQGRETTFTVSITGKVSIS